MTVYYYVGNKFTHPRYQAITAYRPMVVNEDNRLDAGAPLPMAMNDMEVIYDLRKSKKHVTRPFIENIVRSLGGRMSTDVEWKPEMTFRFEQRYESDMALLNNTKCIHHCLSYGDNSLWVHTYGLSTRYGKVLSAVKPLKSMNKDVVRGILKNNGIGLK